MTGRIAQVRLGKNLAVQVTRSWLKMRTPIAAATDTNRLRGSRYRDKKNLWNSQEAEADNKEEDQERHNRDGDKKTIPSLGSTKKRRPSAVEGTSASKRHVKRRRCLSPGRDEAVSSQDNIFTVPGQDLDSQPDGTSPESKGIQPKLHNITFPRGPASDTATNPPTLEQAQGHSDAAQVEEPELEITKILDKRENVSGTDYKVRWKSTWLPQGELRNARKLLREFEANGRARHARKRGTLARTDKTW